MKTIGCVACGLALLGPATVHAQTSITREIANEPVETVVTRGPNGTIVTRRPLNPAGPAYETLYPSVEYAPPRRPVVVEDTVEREPPSTVGIGTRATSRTTRPTEVTGRMQPRRQVARDRVARERTREVVRTREQAAPSRPLALSPAERQIVYRTIVQREVYPAPARPVVQPAYPPVYAQQVIEPPVRTYPQQTIYPFANDYAYTNRYTYQTYDEGYANGGYAYARYPVRTYVVGSRLSESVPLVTVPESVAIQVPATRPYRYAVINNRVYLVDPVTSFIVADVTP